MFEGVDEMARWRSAEFFAGIGLVRAALERQGIDVVWANDIEESKAAIYAANFDASDFVLGDVRDVQGDQLPDIDLATASFPCTDLSLAGNRSGLQGKQSSMLWEFLRVLHEMGNRAPRLVLLENVLGFATSKKGADLASAIKALNELGYWCDIFTADARWFIPQSRPRMFIIGSKLPFELTEEWTPSVLRPKRLCDFANNHPELRLHARPLPDPSGDSPQGLADVVERLPKDDPLWWDKERLDKFLGSLSDLNKERLSQMMQYDELTWRTAYRRTRKSKAIWEIRSDNIAGCLRTARGGSSKQAVVEAGRGEVRVRWMTPREYARLQGAPHFKFDHVRPNQAYFGFGDAVCVPVIEWIAKEYLVPVLCESTANNEKKVVAHA